MTVLMVTWLTRGYWYAREVSNWSLIYKISFLPLTWKVSIFEISFSHGAFLRRKLQQSSYQQSGEYFKKISLIWKNSWRMFVIKVCHVCFYAAHDQTWAEVSGFRKEYFCRVTESVRNSIIANSLKPCMLWIGFLLGNNYFPIESVPGGKKCICYWLFGGVDWAQFSVCVGSNAFQIVRKCNLQWAWGGTIFLHSEAHEESWDQLCLSVEKSDQDKTTPRWSNQMSSLRTGEDWFLTRGSNVCTDKLLQSFSFITFILSPLLLWGTAASTSIRLH